jgi:acyl-coenzyme A thioesterase PaaI-like protein
VGGCVRVGDPASVVRYLIAAATSAPATFEGYVNVTTNLIEQSGDAYRRCFGCGTENPIGLRLVFRNEDGAAVADFRPRPEYQGWDRMLHGGIVLTMLDETLAYAALFAAGPAVTAEISARLRSPGPMDQSYRLRGTVSKVRLGLVQAQATIHTERGALVAEATGKFMLIRSS